MKNNENIKVSIITPTFNDGAFIKATLDSILNQTHTNLEVIIVDDKSTDDTVAIVKSFNDERIKLFLNDTNKGAAYSRNRALKEATGDFIAFLDGDDLWKNDKLEKQLNFMVANNYSFSCTSYELINEESMTLGVKFKAPQKISHKKFMKGNFVGCLTVMYKKAICPNLEIPDNISKRNDYALWLKISEKCDCYYLDEILAYYRKRLSSISSDKKSLIKHHEIMIRSLYSVSKFRAYIFCVNNITNYWIKKFFFIKKSFKGKNVLE